VRIYVAGASKEPQRVRWAMDGVRDLGCELTLDWLAVIDAAGAANEGLNDAERRKYARADLAAVRCADLVWLLAPDNASTGAWVELGYAVACGVPIVVSGRARTRCIFASLGAEFDEDIDALAYVALRRAGE
jgi:nucleoside 2-deoxyribosyltransferase